MSLKEQSSGSALSRELRFVGLSCTSPTDEDTLVPDRAQAVEGEDAGLAGVFEFGVREGTACLPKPWRRQVEER